MPFPNQSKGEITSRDLLITASITLAAAAVMIAIVVVLSRQNNRAGEDARTQDQIKQIQQKTLDLGAGAPGPNEPTAEETFEPRATHTGTLASREPGARIVVRTTNKEEAILLSAGTVITINGQTAPESDLSPGDTVRVSVERGRDGTQTALEIVVLRSTSPTVPTNVSAPTIQPDPVESRPVSPY